MSHRLKVVHIDDDPTFLESFKAIASKAPAIDYQQGFTDLEEALTYIQLHLPNLIFVDVVMPGKNGFWLAEKVQQLPLDVVFITSYAGYAMKAFEACAVDYLLKPVTEEKLHEFISRYKSQRKRNSNITDLQLKELVTHYLEEGEKPTRIFINTAGKIDIINLDEVLYFSSKGNFTEIVMLDGTKHISGKSIKTYEDAIFKNTGFLRIHRSSIINKLHVKTILRDSRKHRFAVVMKNNEELEISFLRKDEILGQLMK